MATRKPAAKKTAKPAKPAKRKASPVPNGFRTATPYLIVRGAKDALAFYARAFGAKNTLAMEGPGGRVMHAEMRIGDSMLMLTDENPQWGCSSPLLLGGNATHVMLYVKDVDAFVAKAVAAGASLTMPVSNQFWGDRYGKITDPYGHVWSVATHIEDLTPKQLKLRSEAAMKAMAEAAG